jgi:hypothetical protein
MSSHNKQNFERFLELRHLISCAPVDVALLKQELKENYYFQRIKTLADLKRHLSNEEEENFFGRSARRFFGTSKYKFSKRDFVLTCYNKHGVATYRVYWSGENLSLICDSTAGV